MIGRGIATALLRRLVCRMSIAVCPLGQRAGWVELFAKPVIAAQPTRTN
jgi:hypothetical protein